MRSHVAVLLLVSLAVCDAQGTFQWYTSKTQKVIQCHFTDDADALGSGSAADEDMGSPPTILPPPVYEVYQEKSVISCHTLKGIF